MVDEPLSWEISAGWNVWGGAFPSAKLGKVFREPVVSAVGCLRICSFALAGRVTSVWKKAM